MNMKKMNCTCFFRGTLFFFALLRYVCSLLENKLVLLVITLFGFIVEREKEKEKAKKAYGV